VLVTLNLSNIDKLYQGIVLAIILWLYLINFVKSLSDNSKGTLNLILKYDVNLAKMLITDEQHGECKIWCRPNHLQKIYNSHGLALDTAMYNRKSVNQSYYACYINLIRDRCNLEVHPIH